jgi:hypothetical protein
MIQNAIIFFPMGSVKYDTYHPDYNYFRIVKTIDMDEYIWSFEENGEPNKAFKRAGLGLVFGFVMVHRSDYQSINLHDVLEFMYQHDDEDNGDSKIMAAMVNGHEKESYYTYSDT